MGFAPVPLFPIGGGYIIPPPPIPPSPPTAAEIADALAGRFGPVHIRYRYEQRSHDFDFQADLTSAVEGGQIDLDNFRAITRTGIFIIRPSRLPAAFTDDDHLAVFAEVLAGDFGLFARYPLGMFKLDTIIEQHSPSANEVWRISGSDLMLHLFEDQPQAAYTVPAGSIVTTTVSDIIQSAELRGAIVPSTEVTAIDLVWPPRTSKGQICNDLLKSINYYDCWADGEGIIRSRRNIDPFDEPGDVTYSSQTEPRMISGDGSPFSWQRARAQYANQVTVVVKDPGAASSAVIITNDDSDSRISTVNKGTVTGVQENGDRFASVAKMAEHGRNILRQVSVLSQSGTLLTRVDPRRDAHEHYVLDLPEAGEASTKWRVLGWSLNLDNERPASTMSHRIGRATELTLSEEIV